MNRKMLDGKVIIVVGASGGLGKVFATEFAREGAIVVMTGRNEEKLRQAAAEVAEETGGRTFPVQADYKDKEDCDRLFDTVLAEFGTFDGLVTNASSTGEQLSLEVTDEAYVDEIIDTDVKGLIRYNRRALQHFLEKDSGCILNIGSNNLQHPICDSVYCAAKYAMYGLSKQLAMRCVGTGVRVNILNPGSFPSASGANATTFADVDTSHLYDAGELVIGINNQRTADIVDKMYSWIVETDDTFIAKKKLSESDIFTAERSIITYGEIRDSADAQVATHACQTGLRMFSTVHAGDCIRTVNRLLDLDVSRMSLLEELKLIVCQRLIGLLCPKCSRPHKLTEQERQVLTPEEIEEVETFGMRERGSVAARKACTCQDGLVGRIAIPEYVIFDNDLRNALLHMDSFDAIPKLLKEHGFKSMWEKGLDLVENGQAELSDVIQKIGRD